MTPSNHARQMLFFIHWIGQECRRTQPGVLSVPFIAHNPEQAYAATLSMVLGYYGRQLHTPGVAATLHSANWSECDIPRTLASEVRACGLDAAVTAGNLSRMMEWMLQEVPVIVFPEHEIRGPGEPVAVVTGISRDQTAVCLHYGSNPHHWLRLPDFLALCGGDNFTAVPVMERHLPTHSRTRNRSQRPGHDRSWLDFIPEPASAMAA